MKKFILKWLGIQYTPNEKELKRYEFYLCEQKDKFNLFEKNLVKNCNDIETIKSDIKRYRSEILDIYSNLMNRRQEISLVIEQLQNLDNHEVIRDLHLRILELEKRGEK